MKNVIIITALLCCVPTEATLQKTLASLFKPRYHNEHQIMYEKNENQQTRTYGRWVTKDEYFAIKSIREACGLPAVSPSDIYDAEHGYWATDTYYADAQCYKKELLGENKTLLPDIIKKRQPLLETDTITLYVYESINIRAENKIVVFPISFIELSKDYFLYDYYRIVQYEGLNS